MGQASATAQSGYDGTYRVAGGPQIARKGCLRGSGAGGGVGVRRLLGVGEGRGLIDLEQKIAFRFFDNLYT